MEEVTDIKQLRKITENVPKLGQGSSIALTDKMWVDPAGKIIPLSTQHCQFFRDPDVAQEWGVEYSTEQPTRLAALAVGFIRVNYERRSGTLTVESSQRGWTRRAKDTIFMLVADNVAAVDNISVSILDGEGRVIRSGYAQLFSYSDREKLEHIPLISASQQGKALIAVFQQVVG